MKKIASTKTLRNEEDLKEWLQTIPAKMNRWLYYKIVQAIERGKTRWVWTQEDGFIDVS